MEIDSFMKRHLSNYLADNFPHHFEQFQREAFQFLSSLDRDDLKYWLDQGWDKLADTLDFWKKSAR